MSLKFSSSASFDIDVATKYGVNAALLINHFAHWIRINQRAGRNCHGGRTWMYQTMDQIAEQFPYFTKEQIRTTLDWLCTGKNRHSPGEKQIEPILMKGNFNKLSFDKTTWFAFVDESFLNSNNSYERANAQIDNGKCPLEKGKCPTLIPEANNTEAINPFLKKGANISAYEEESPESPLPNRKILIASLIFFARNYGLLILEREVGIWLTKYDTERIQRNLILASKRRPKILIRFMEAALKYDYAKEEDNVKINREFFKRFCFENSIPSKMTQKYATLPGGYDLQFKLSPTQFNENVLNFYSKL